MGPRKAFVTLLTNSSYLPAALVLNESLKSAGSKYPLVIMATLSLPSEVREALTRQGLEIAAVDPLKPAPNTHILSDLDIRFTDAWTKLRGFGLVEFERVILLDCDMIVLRNMDELFDLVLPDGWIAATHACACNPMGFAHYPTDWIPENCAFTPLEHPTALTHPTEIQPDSPRAYGLLNSGAVVLDPSNEAMSGLAEFLSTSPLVPTFRFVDQDLLAAFYKGRWKPLPWCYNALKTLRKIHKPLWRDEEVRCLHYILAVKPWQTKTVEEWEKEMYGWWWDRYRLLEDRLSHGGDEVTLKLIRENVVQ